MGCLSLVLCHIELMLVSNFQILFDSHMDFKVTDSKILKSFETVGFTAVALRFLYVMLDRSRILYLRTLVYLGQKSICTYKGFVICFC